jgi:hypothetical protein
MTDRRTRTVAALYAAILALSGIGGPAPIVRATVTVPFAEVGEQQIGPGIVRAWGQVSTDTGGLSTVQFIRVDPSDPNVRFEALLSNDTATDLETVQSMAYRATSEGHQVVAAVNGDFWSGLGGVLAAPNGLHVHLGELMASRAGIRPTFGVDASRTVHMDNVNETASLDLGTGTTYAIGRVNQTRADYQIDLYTPRFGTSTATPADGTEVVLTGVPGPIAPSGEYPAVVQSVNIGAGNTPLAPGTLVLSQPGAGGVLETLTPGQPVTVRTAITPGWEGVTEAIGGGEWVLQAGVVGVSPAWSGATATDARTGLGVTADGRVIIATVDGAQPGYSAGVRLTELGQLLKAEGAVRGLNFDGGGSTTLVARQPGDPVATLANRPSRGQRMVSNALAVVSTAPTGPLAGLAIRPTLASVTVGSTTAFSVVGWDAAMNAVTVPPGAATWTASGGTIDAAGSFLATTPGVATIQAVALGSSAQVTIPVAPSTDIGVPVPVVGTSGTAASALGITTSGPFSTATKLPALGKYITVKVSFGASAAGATVVIWGASKNSAGVWSAFTAKTTRIADASGNVDYYVRSASTAWLSFQGRLGAVRTNAVQAHWR